MKLVYEPKNSKKNEIIAQTTSLSIYDYRKNSLKGKRKARPKNYMSNIQVSPDLSIESPKELYNSSGDWRSLIS